MFGTGVRDYANPSVHRRMRRARRGRSTFLAVLVAMVAMIVLAGVAYGGGAPSQHRVLVQPGQTLWAIAQSAYPGDDIQQRVADIESANHLNGGLITPGECLLLPAP
ncbi:MAG TPA: LysM peptidoglycan-binding domain-containing protein [Dehalococcoidia bacterium]|nr:LysM peptidoglycan-binding domain-containing protein [Dehalococcoidia bacterium]